MNPYREPPPLRIDDEQPPCTCGTSPETRAAYAAVGGWWHTVACIEWHRALHGREPRHPEMQRFLATCDEDLRAEFR